MDQASITLVSASEAVNAKLGKDKAAQPVPRSFRFGALPSLMCQGERLPNLAPMTTTSSPQADKGQPLVVSATNFSIFDEVPGIVWLSIIVALSSLLGFVWGKLLVERDCRLVAEEACDGYETWLQHDDTEIRTSAAGSTMGDTEKPMWPVGTTRAGRATASVASAASMRTSPRVGTSIAPSSRGGSRATSRYGGRRPTKSTPRSTSSSGPFYGRKVIVVLEKARLGSLKGVRGEDGPLMIVHECLLTIFDSPLQKDGKLTVYMHSDKDVLVEVHPAFVVPRTFDPFQRLMNALLRQGEVGADGLRPPVMRCIEPPVEQYFPQNCTCFGLTEEGRPENLRQIAGEADEGEACYVFAIGASEGDALMEEHMFGGDYAGNKISISPHELTAAAVCQMVCAEFAESWVTGASGDEDSSFGGSSTYF